MEIAIPDIVKQHIEEEKDERNGPNARYQILDMIGNPIARGLKKEEIGIIIKQEMQKPNRKVLEITRDPVDCDIDLVLYFE